MFGLGKEFNDGTKRINIDYKRIEEYGSPFVMTLEVENKKKLDVWEVQDGKEANEIRNRYKKINRRTSYVDFYKTTRDLISEKGIKGLEFHPRIRATKKSKDVRDIDQTEKPKVNYKEIEEITISDLYGVDFNDVKYLLAQKINQVIYEMNNRKEGK